MLLNKKFNGFAKNSYFWLSISTLIYVYCLSYLSSRTLDLTDESYYLVSIRDYKKYAQLNGVSLFGPIFHNLLLINKSVFFLRFAVQIIITLLCLILLYTINTKLNFVTSQKQYILVLFFSLVPGFTVSGFLFTPNYNTLTLMGLLVFAISFFLNKSRMIILLQAVGFTLLFFAKPPSFLLTLIIFVIFQLVRNSPKIKDTILTGTCTAVGIAIGYLIIFGSITIGISNFESSAKLIDESHKSGLLSNLILQLFPSNFFAVFCVSISFLMVLSIKEFETAEIRNAYIMVTLLPMAGVLGTNTNYWDKSIQFLPISLIIGITLVQNAKNNFINEKVYLILVLIGILILAMSGLHKTYRSSYSINQNVSSLVVPNLGSVLVPIHTKESLDPLISAIRKNSNPQDKILDATGKLPIIALLADRDTTGLPWFGSGSGQASIEYRATRIKVCNSESSLILVENSTQNNTIIDPILNQFSMRKDRDFKVIYESFNFDPYKLGSVAIKVSYSKKKITCQE